MKLKTLKDLYGVVERGRNELMDDWVSVQKLKAEAIKHIRVMFQFHHYDAAYSMMHFFNISEEDLKIHNEKGGVK